MPNKSKRRALTEDDLFAITVVSDPQLSPDGTLLAWVQTRPDKQKDLYLGSIWISNSNGENPRQLTSGTNRDTTPRWSPDSSTLAFVSNRSPMLTPPTKPESDPEKPGSNPPISSSPVNQIWTISVSGGEAVQRSNHLGGASQPSWSPDGQILAYIGKDAVEPKEGETPPISIGPIADERVVTAVTYRFDGSGFQDSYSHIWRVSLDGGDDTQLTNGFQHDNDPHWSPDGTTIAFSGNRSAHTPQTWGRTQVLTVPSSGGDVTMITPEDSSFESPRWSPDGKRIAFLGHSGTASGPNSQVWTVDATGSNLVCETANHDLSFSDLGMSDVYAGSDQAPQWVDNSTIRTLASADGETQVYEISVGKGTVKPVTKGKHRISAFTAGKDDFVVLKGVIDAPFTLEKWKSKSNPGISSPNAQFLETVGLNDALPLNVTSADGKPIQGWIIPPWGFDPKSAVRHPLIVQIHGGPHAMYGYAMFHEMQLMAARGYAVAFCNPRGSSGYGEEFTTCTKGVWGESDMPDVIALTEAAAELPWIDESRLGLTGGSYGGYLTNWIIGHDKRFKAAVTQRCVSSFVSFFGTSDIGTTFGVDESDGLPWSDHAKLLSHSPIAYVDKIETPLLILHSEKDLRCPIEQAEQMFASLKYLGREVKFVRIPDESHDLSRSGTPSRRLARLHHLIGWFDTHL